jgi:hypothetical protein
METNLNLKALFQKIPPSVKLAAVIVIAAKLLVFTVGYITVFWNHGGGTPLVIIADMFNKWDAPHYLDIAKNGYINIGDQANFIVFFPLYPTLVRFFTPDFNYINYSALAVSNACSIIAFIYLYKLAKHEFNETAAVKAVLFLSVFPTAYFLSAPYTEGIFFATVIAAVYYSRIGKWPLAGAASMLAALSRLAGLLLLPVLVIEYLHQKGWKLKDIRLDAIWACFAAVGFLIYLGINFSVDGNPFQFVVIEAQHWQTTMNPWVGLNNMYGWMLNASYPDNVTIGLAPFVFFFFGLAMFSISVWRRMRPSYVIYMFLYWGIAVATSWGISVPRYIMAMFPMFLLAGASIKNKYAAGAIAITSGAVMCYFTFLFAVGAWAF